MKKLVTQKDIIKQLAMGQTYQHIRTMYGISANTMYAHIKRIRAIGLEPTDPNALRKHILGPMAKPLVSDYTPASLSPLQDKILRLFDAGHTIHQIPGMLQIGFQTVRNIACGGFRRIGITRKTTPERVWRTQLRGYFASIDGKKPAVTMEDPFFN